MYPNIIHNIIANVKVSVSVCLLFFLSATAKPICLWKPLIPISSELVKTEYHAGRAARKASFDIKLIKPYSVN